MDNLERKPNHELESFTEKIVEAIPEAIEMSEMFGSPSPIDPSSLGITNFRTMDDMTSHEKLAVVHGIYRAFDLSPKTIKQQLVRKYKTPHEETGDTLTVSVYRTNQDVFLQEVVYPQDGQKRFFVGPDENI